MKQLLRLMVFLIVAVGFSSCGAVSSGFLYPDETGYLKAEPSRIVYSINTSFIKSRDLTVYLYSGDGRRSKIPIEKVSILLGRIPITEDYTFEEYDSGATWVVDVEYAAMRTDYSITILSAEEKAYYDSGGAAGGGIEIIIEDPEDDPESP